MPVLKSGLGHQCINRTQLPGPCPQADPDCPDCAGTGWHTITEGTNTVDRCPCAGATITPIRENIVSYCRWSSDDFLSDVYAYEDAEGWALHVADRHPAIDLDKLGSVPAPDDIDAYLDRHRKLKDLLRGATLQPIEHPEAGKSYVFDCPGDLADKLDQLSRDGLHVPTGVVDALREEQAEITAKTIRRTS